MTHQDDDSPSKLLKVLKPGGLIHIYKVIDPSMEQKSESLFADEITKLRMAGFRMKDTKIIPSLSSNVKLQDLLKVDAPNSKLFLIQAEKPNYEVFFFSFFFSFIPR